MASRGLQQIVAAEVALGASTGELAERHGYTRRGMRKLFHSPSVQTLVADEREALADTTERYRAQPVGLGQAAIENIRRAVEDPKHPRNLETSRWLLDRVAFPSANGPLMQVDLEPHITPEALRALFEGIAKLQAAHAASAGQRIPALEEHLILPPGDRGLGR